jgi:tRNA (cmo5U34)-methyltransferase
VFENWKREEIAQTWDADPTGHNPTREEQLDIMLSILGDTYQQGKAILDVGLGSGIVEELIFKRIPGAHVVGIDSSQAMVNLANRRLQPYKGQYEVVMHDITEIGSIEMPRRDYQVAISVQTIHNVADEYKKPIFDFVYGTLEKGGLFLLLDRMAVDTPHLFDCYKSMWERLDKVYGAHLREGATFEQHIQSVRARGDLPANLEQHLVWLRESGFETACLHLHGNRALIAGRKV